LDVSQKAVYLDASVLVKRYVRETGTAEVQELLRAPIQFYTATITKVEVSAAFAKGVRVGILSPENAEIALKGFYEDWLFLERIQITEAVITRAASLAWELQLRGYDATHLAAAVLLQELINLPTVMATFDLRLWRAARNCGLSVWPKILG